MNLQTKALHYLRSYTHPTPLGLNLEKMATLDSRQFNADVLGAWFEKYQPKHQSVVLSTFSIKNQYPQNSCVPESGAIQKEPEEGVELSPQWMSAHLRSKGLMDRNGTTLEAFQNELVKVGMAEKQFAPNVYNVRWEDFSSGKYLTQQSYDNAALHKAKSHWHTYKLDTVLQNLDEGRRGQTGSEWFTGYNPSQMRAPWILQPKSGVSVGGHAYNIVGYNLDYYGQDVLILATSYGNSYNQGHFYLKFEDFTKVLSFGVFFNLDLEKDVASWLSLHAGKPILAKNGVDVYVIESDKKRWVKNEALMNMLEITPSMLFKDTDDILSQVKTGEPMSVNDIPAHKIEAIKYFVAGSRDPNYMKSRYGEFFPELFTK